jgi:hypothetical protein
LRQHSIPFENAVLQQATNFAYALLEADQLPWQVAISSALKTYMAEPYGHFAVFP